MSAVTCLVKYAKRPAWRAAFDRVWQDCMRRLRDPYRPELHYMRGPGPKCREKALRHGSS